jgi:hypothetical protein
MKGSAGVDSMGPVALNFYAGICAGICGWAREAGGLRRRIRRKE